MTTAGTANKPQDERAYHWRNRFPQYWPCDGRYTSATLLVNVGIPTRVEYRYAIMHDKFIVIDGVTVEEGSFNFTSAAEHKNAENVLVLHDPAVAQRYGQEWETLWAESKEMKGRY